MKKIMVKIIISFCIACIIGIVVGFRTEETKYFNCSFYFSNGKSKSKIVEINKQLYDSSLKDKLAGSYNDGFFWMYDFSKVKIGFYTKTIFNYSNCTIYGFLSFSITLLLLLAPEMKNLRSIE